MGGTHSNPKYSGSRHLTTQALLAARDCARWDRADLDGDPAGWDFAEESAAFLDWRIAEDEAELVRRERLRSHPMAPDWPSPRQDLDVIRERVDLAAYVEKMTAATFTKRGPRLWTSCPLPDHQDTDPSFCIGPDPTLWFCFGCGRGGDLFAFCEEIHGGIDFASALALLTIEAGIVRPDAAPRRDRRGGPPRMELRGGKVVRS